MDVKKLEKKLDEAIQVLADNDDKKDEERYTLLQNMIIEVQNYLETNNYNDESNKELHEELQVCIDRFKKDHFIFIIFIILFGLLLLGGIFYISYSYFYTIFSQDRISINRLNLDTDKDGKPDVNITDGDENIPKYNIDWGDRKHGNEVATFNVRQKDGSLFNRTNRDTNGDGKPDINVDVDGDGWPDINVDLDGDGKPDLNLDIDGDKKPDINIDSDRDGKPDDNKMNQDVNKDNYCDFNCDKDDDGWPDINVDVNNDKVCDYNCYTKENPDVCYKNCRDDKNVCQTNCFSEKKPDVCIKNCDPNLDSICDYNCYDQENPEYCYKNCYDEKDPDVCEENCYGGTPETCLYNCRDKDGVCTYNCDNNKDGVCDEKCPDTPGKPNITKRPTTKPTTKLPTNSTTKKPTASPANPTEPSEPQEQGLVSVIFDTTDLIDIENVMPIEDSEGKNTTPTKWKLNSTISNSSKNYEIRYTINFIDLMDEIAANERLNLNYLRFNLMIFKGGKQIYDSGTQKIEDYPLNNSGYREIITRADSDRNTYKKDETLDFELRMWLDKDTGNSEQGKKYKFRVNVEAEAEFIE